MSGFFFFFVTSEQNDPDESSELRKTIEKNQLNWPLP